MRTPTDFASLVDVFLGILQSVVPVIFSVTLLYILWKVVQLWILNAGETEKIAEGKRVAFIGVIALVIMAGIWGILALLREGIFG